MQEFQISRIRITGDHGSRDLVGIAPYWYLFLRCTGTGTVRLSFGESNRYF
jgi:hypothetical protein